MSTAKTFDVLRQAAIGILLSFILPAQFFICVEIAVAQQPTEINKELRNKTTTAPRSDKPIRALKKSTPAIRQSTQTNSRQTKPNSIVEPRLAVENIGVWLTTKVGNADIVINGKSFGRTDSEGKLFVTLATGNYLAQIISAEKEILNDPTVITISRKNFIIPIAHRSPSNMNSTPTNAAPVQTNKMAVATRPRTVENPKPTDAPRQCVALQNSTQSADATVKAIMQCYSDPKYSDTILNGDWQYILDQVKNGKLAEFSEVQKKAIGLFALGQITLNDGDNVNAVRAFDSATLLLPSSPLAFHGLGNAYLASRQFNEAYIAYQQSLHLDSANAIIYKKIGDALTMLNKRSEAVKFYEQARVLGYDTVNTRLSLATNLLADKKWSEAWRLLYKLVQEKPVAMVFVALGDSYIGMNMPKSAIESYRAATNLEPLSASAHAKLGAALLTEKQFTEADAALSKALLLDPTGTLIDRETTRKLLKKAKKLRRAAA